MAFYLEYEGKEFIRKGAYICIRNDRESLGWNTDQIEQIISGELGIETFSNNELNFESVRFDERKNELEQVFCFLKSKRIVVTDRLHCMIFCALVGTPCIALDNASKKISATYEWIKDLDYIACVQEEKEISYAIKKVLKCPVNKNLCLDDKFLELSKYIKGFL